jgi:hypothetical protein
MTYKKIFYILFYMYTGNSTENDKLKKEIKVKEKIILKELNRIEESSIETVQTLKKQGESLDKIKQNTEVINNNVGISEKIIQKMKGFSFLFVNKKKLENQIEDNNDKKVVSDNKEKEKSKSIFNIFRSKQQEEIKKTENKEPDPLDMMLNHIGKIKTNVSNQQELMNRQNADLDSVIKKTEETNDKLKKINKNIKKIN